MKAFIFDMDGVIIDSEPLHEIAKRRTLYYYGLNFPDDIFSQYTGRTTKTLFSDLIKADGRTDINVDSMVEHKHEAYLRGMRNGEAKLVDGIKEIFETLKANNIPMALASSSGRVSITFTFEYYGLTDYFSAIVTGTELKESKPNPEIYFVAAQKLGVDPTDCVVIEDATAGIAAGKAAGMYVIGYRNPNSGKQDLSHADEIVDSLRDINVIELLKKERQFRL